MVPLVGAALIAGGSQLLSGIIGAIGGNKAAKAQASAYKAGIKEQRRQFDALQALLSPYVSAGTSALGSMSALTGAAGDEAQAAAIADIEGGSEYKQLVKQGENAILQNASATGGLRGGNVQNSLANFRSNALTSLINQQYNRLGGLAQLGQASAAGVGSAGMQTGSNISSLLASMGSAQAGGIMAGASGLQAIPNALMAGLGTYAGLGGTF